MEGGSSGSLRTSHFHNHWEEEEMEGGSVEGVVYPRHGPPSHTQVASCPVVWNHLAERMRTGSVHHKVQC